MAGQPHGRVPLQEERGPARLPHQVLQAVGGSQQAGVASLELEALLEPPRVVLQVLQPVEVHAGGLQSDLLWGLSRHMTDRVLVWGVRGLAFRWVFMA